MLFGKKSSSPALHRFWFYTSNHFSQPPNWLINDYHPKILRSTRRMLHGVT